MWHVAEGVPIWARVPECERQWQLQATWRGQIFGRNNIFNRQPDIPLGLCKKPSLLKCQGSILATGENLTFQCGFDTSYDRFNLSKQTRCDFFHSPDWQFQFGFSNANFAMSHVWISYVCYYTCFSMWLVPSNNWKYWLWGWSHVSVRDPFSLRPCR